MIGIAYSNSDVERGLHPGPGQRQIAEAHARGIRHGICQCRGSGALVLSEFTGAATELREAVPCNPFDVEGLSRRVEHALRLPADRRRRALTAMARYVRGHDVHRWVAGQLADIAARGAAR